MADGYVARKTHTVSILGSKLDSIADFILIVVLLYVLYPILQPSKEILLWIAAIAFIRLSAITTVCIRYGYFASLHTYANKATGLALFLFPFSLMVTSSAIPLVLVLVLATCSASEELIINITSKKLNLETKGFFDNL